MTDLTIKVPAIEKLLDYAASGIGAVAGPMLAPWKAEREGKARIIAARADAEVRRIETQSDAKSLAIIADAQAEARQYLLPSNDQISGTLEIERGDVFQRIKYQEQKRLANIGSVVTQAASDIDGKEVADHDPDPDWTARFFDSVQDISSSDMQTIWAKILSGEVESPGRTSLRTLDTLRNMTREEAEIFRNACDFVIESNFLFHKEGGLSKQSELSFDTINYRNIHRLQDCNLLSAESGLTRIFKIEKDNNIVLEYQSDGILITNKSGSTISLRFPALRLTSAGENLYGFVQCSPQMEYLQSIGEFLNREKCELDYLQKMVRLDGGMVGFEKRIRIGESVDELINGAD